MTDLSEEMASDLDADIAEEDQAGPGFDDEQLQEHRELDENNS
jgi:hypothetical protein